MYFYCLYFCNQEKCYSGNKIVTFPGALLTAIQVTVIIAGLPVLPRLPHSLLSTWSPYLLEAEVPWPVILFPTVLLSGVSPSVVSDSLRPHGL